MPQRHNATTPQYHNTYQNMKIQVQKRAQLTGHNSSIFKVVPFKQPHLFLSGAGDGWVVVWDLNDPEMGRLISKVETQIFSMKYLHGHEMVVAGNMDGGVHWINLNDPDATKNIAHHNKGVFAIERVGESVLTAGGVGVLTRWDIKEARTIESLHLTNKSLRSIAYSEARNELAIGASDHCIYLLDAINLTIKQVIEKAHDNSVFTILYSPDNKYLISGGRDAHLRIRDIENDFKEISAQAAHWYTINDLAFHPKGHLLATASRDKTIKIWDATSFELVKVLDTVRDGGHVNSVNHLYWSNHQNELISCSDDRSIIVWSVIE